MRCKVCDSRSKFFFSNKIINKYDVSYFQCSSCGFVQTEDPYWLDEAYSSPITDSDIGILMRNEMLFQLSGNIIMTFFNHDAKFLDYGAGYGLFVRMMRDRGIDFSWNDQYCDNLFSKGFEGSVEEPYELITSFEVFEHLVDPVETIGRLTQSSKNILFSTELLPPSNPTADDWWYYCPHEGQHISIFTLKSLAIIAERFGLNLYSNGSFFHLLTEKSIDQQEFLHWSQYSPDGFGKQSLLLQDVATLAERKASKSALPAKWSTPPSRTSTDPLIVIDGVFFQISNTGIARVWSSILKEWSQTDFAKNIVVLDRAKTVPRIPGITYRNIDSYDYENIESERELIQAICNDENASVFISTYYTTPLTTPSVFMGYDMIPEVMDWDLRHPMWVDKHHSIRQASAWITISKQTSEDLIKCFPDIVKEQIVIAYPGIDRSIFNISNEEKIFRFKEKYGISKPYFLLVGHRTAYKNAILFFQAFSRLSNCSDLEILCVCPISTLEPELAEYVNDYQVHTLLLNDNELSVAYSGAIALAYPSKYEGFGLPILEAMACSCPVITCAISSMPEVAGEAAIFIDPDDVEGMMNALIQVQDASVRQDLIEKGLIQAETFSWAKMAGLIADKLLETSQLFQDQRDCNSNETGEVDIPISAGFFDAVEIREKNLIIFPDWELCGDELFESLLNPFREIVCDELCDRTSLLVYVGDRDPEEADLLMSSVLMYLVIEEGIEVSDIGPAVIFLDEEASSDLHQISTVYTCLSFDGEDKDAAEIYQNIQSD
jgi:glycosyltransferase involved in cell wall biosynthesis